MSETNFAGVLEVLVRAQVDFILIGGVAAIAHGCARATFDIDVVYSREKANLARLAAALAPHQPYLRGIPAGLPFFWDERSISQGLNFTLTTALGDLDLLGEVTGGGGYEDLLPHSEQIEIFGFAIRVVTLERLIQLKRAAGRPKDLEAVAELVALLEERDRNG